MLGYPVENLIEILTKLWANGDEEEKLSRRRDRAFTDWWYGKFDIDKKTTDGKNNVLCFRICSRKEKHGSFFYTWGVSDQLEETENTESTLENFLRKHAF